MAEIITIEKTKPRLVPAKVVAEFLGVTQNYVRACAESIPGFLCVNASGRKRLFRWDMNQIEAWQQRQQQEREG